VKPFCLILGGLRDQEGCPGGSPGGIVEKRKYIQNWLLGTGGKPTQVGGGKKNFRRGGELLKEQ